MSTAAPEPPLTPMMAQYRRVKSELPKDALLLFRLGDFYEMFFEDAVEGARLLNVALTKRGVVPMCGIPHHAFNSYVARILRAGRKVAVCDQVEEARPGQLVKREVTQILSPGTHFDERLLAAERNNFLAAVYPAGKVTGIAVVDLTTGDFRTTETESDAELLTELERLRPAETIYPGEASSLRTLLAGAPGILIGHDDWVFAPETAVFTVREHFKVAALDGFGLKGRTAATGAAGAALHYLAQHLRRDVKHLTRITFYQCRDYLVLDSTTLRNLEILEPLHRDAPKNTSLYGALNRTVTPMGARLLRNWLTQPLSAVEPIRRRQDAVQSWLENGAALEAFRVKLAEVRDLERTVSRLSVGTGNGRDLHALRMAVEQVPALKQVLADVVGTRCRASTASPSLLNETESEDTQQRVPTLLTDLTAQLTELPALVELIARAIVDEPPLALKEGGLIRDGFDPNLDELRAASRGGKDWIAQLKQKEVERTGIASLKVGFTSVFGYFIEITKANLAKVPADYIRKQTIANGERFITPELKVMEGKILGAEERAMKLEYELFLRVREEVIGNLAAIQQTAAALAQLDVLACFAETARHFNYTRPEVCDAGQLLLREARHPVLDQALTEERFVPNDTELASIGRADLPVGQGADAQQRVPTESNSPSPISHLPSPQIGLITGPNMAGKSTYIRQVALLTLLAHTGSFLPAASARVDLVDRIFTRIGASDDLARGQSTFMVEMSETANILNNATARSLVILDEIGRGTSTFDGLSLAWSIVEHLHNQVGAKTLFATHYHELTELAARMPRLRNYNVAVREWHDQIIFLRKIVEGGTDKSYGIQVARLAGVPKEVLERAKVILRNLEDSELTPEGTVRQTSRRQQDREKLKQVEANPQMDLFR
ncbi:MAG: DNA mismatch repair protein MutS [Limisphaerales bacterium]|nr:MAG: DNA mismatch repair protein MutS [Limisphaerales bacterium]KAG0509222.1 MAG: DNA mismatch repair protein MutS [Limisphaerales bacterium]TXT52239.1 MAG: DNA mismatch repair protein MutS [Limisphaerales bacterium]